MQCFKKLHLIASSTSACNAVLYCATQTRHGEDVNNLLTNDFKKLTRILGAVLKVHDSIPCARENGVSAAWCAVHPRLVLRPPST